MISLIKDAEPARWHCLPPLAWECSIIDHLTWLADSDMDSMAQDVREMQIAECIEQAIFAAGQRCHTPQRSSGE
jgi:hypothetical protein